MALRWDIINENILNISKVINDMLDTKNKKTIKWVTKDDEGNVVDSTLPNIATIKDDMVSRIENVLDYKTYQQQRNQRRELYPGSGQIDENSDFTNFIAEDYIGNKTFLHTMAYPEPNKYLHNALAFPLHEKQLQYRQYKPVFNIDGHRIVLYGTAGNFEESPWYNVWDGTTFGIKFPDGLDIDKTITSLKSLDSDIDRGNIILLKAENENLFRDPEFENDIGKDWIAYNTANVSTTLEKDTNSIIIKNGKMWTGFYQDVNLIPGVKYRLEVDVEFINTDNYEAYLWLGYSGREGEYVFKPQATDSSTGKLVAEFVATRYRERIQIQVHVLDSNKSLGDIKFSNPKLYILEDTIVAYNGGGCEKGEDITDISSNKTKFFRSTYGNTRKDLVFLEVWEEKISDKDVVYPLGNIQWRGNDILNNGKLKETDWFDGYDTYSLFGNWQDKGELVGLGYKWSELTEEEQTIFANNPDNNIHRDKNGNLVQVRYRIRVIKGLGNLFLSIDPLVGGDAYNGPMSLFRDNLSHIAPKGSLTSLDSEVREWTGEAFFPSAGVYLLPFYPGAFRTRWTNTYAFPLMLVQRRNKGIYHPVYNPNGTALYYDNGNMLELKDYYDKITRLADCFDPDHICYINPETNDVKSLTEYNSLTDKTGYYRTGALYSQTFRPDNKPYDAITKTDVIDLRRDGRKYSYREILDKITYLHETDKVNGFEYRPDYLKISIYKTDNDTMSITSRMGVFKTDNSNDWYPMTGNIVNRKAYFYDKDDNYITDTYVYGVHTTHGAIDSISFKDNIPDNAYYVKLPIPAYTDATGFNYETTLAVHYGNLTSYKVKPDYIAIPDSDASTDVHTGEVVKVDNDYYVSKANRANLVLDPNKEDYSNTNLWYKITDDTEYLIPKDTLKAGNEVNPLRRNLIANISSDYIIINLNQKLRYINFSKSVKELILVMPDGEKIKIDSTTATDRPYFKVSTYSTIAIYGVNKLPVNAYDFIAKGAIIAIITHVSNPSMVSYEEDIKTVSDIMHVTGTTYDKSFGNLGYMLMNKPLNDRVYGLGVSVKRNQTGTKVLNTWPGYYIEHEPIDGSYAKPKTAVKLLPFISTISNNMYLSYFFKEMKDTNKYNDNPRIPYTPHIDTLLNPLNEKELYGVRRFKLPYYIIKSGV